MEITECRAVLFDLDGVLTPTALIHEEAWGDMFRAFLTERGAEEYTDADYFAYLDGRRRDEGIRAVLKAKNISLPDGLVDDTPETDSVHGLGARKNRDFLKRVAEGVAPYDGSVRFLDYLSGLDNPPEVAVVSSSKNAGPVLAAAGLADRFELVVDGNLASDLGLPGKPAPDTYLHAARELGFEPAEVAVVEDALSGVASGAAGKFGLVIGVNRGAGADALAAAGADVVVDDLEELLP